MQRKIKMWTPCSVCCYFGQTPFRPTPMAQCLLHSAVPLMLVTACQGHALWTPWYTCLIPVLVLMPNHLDTIEMACAHIVTTIHCCPSSIWLVTWHGQAVVIIISMQRWLGWSNWEVVAVGGGQVCLLMMCM